MAFGKDPSREKRCVKARAQIEAGNTFAAIAGEYCDKRKRMAKRHGRPPLPSGANTCCRC